MHDVTVLLSTYNGHKYIRQQLDSIFRQKDVSVRVLVRDDGSTDDTLSILEEYKARYPLTYYQGDNIGPARSFMQLLRDAPQSEYYAFADQDDVWLDGKLSAAVNALKSESKPALYYCQTQLVDKDLNRLPNVNIKPLGTFGESLVYQFIGGNTIVINDALREILISYMPKYLSMHDVWIYDVALAIGAKITFDTTPHLLYRQHDTNAIGQGLDSIELWKRRLHRIIHKEHWRSNLAREIKEGFYTVMPQANRDTLDAFLPPYNWKHKIALIRDKRFICADKGTRRMFQIGVLLNTI